MEETSVVLFEELFLVCYDKQLHFALPAALNSFAILSLLKVVANFNYFYFGGLGEVSDLGKQRIAK